MSIEHGLRCMMENWRKWADRMLTLAFGICVLAVVWVLLQVTGFTSFRVPSPSMYPTLMPGDYILVNKWLMGARIFDIWEAVEELLKAMKHLGK